MAWCSEVRVAGRARPTGANGMARATAMNRVLIRLVDASVAIGTPIWMVASGMAWMRMGNAMYACATGSGGGGECAHGKPKAAGSEWIGVKLPWRFG